MKAASTLMFCAANPLATTAYLPGLTELLDPSPELSMKELRFRDFLNTQSEKPSILL